MNDGLGGAPVCILNPAAGGGVDRDALRRSLAQVLGEGRVRVVATEREGDAERLAREALRGGATALISAGGDGTLHGVVNGRAVEESSAPVAVLPLGTANDFVRSAGLPAGAEDAIAALVTAVPRRVDLIRVEIEPGTDPVRVRRTVNACTGGIIGAVALDAAEEDKARWGQFAYAKTAFDVLTGEPEPYDVRIRLDDDSIEGPVLVAVIANGGRAGGGVPVAPGAEVDDRRLDFVLVRDAPLSTVLAQLPRLVTSADGATESRDRGEDEPDAVVHRRVRSVEVWAGRPMPWSLDGEPTEATRIRFVLEPGRLVLLAPDEAG